MLWAVRPPLTLVEMKYNMVWDGIFHAFTWSMVVLGLWRLWLCGRHKDVPWSGRTLVGSMIVGWGLFNFIEGLLNHQILGIHHVRPGETQLIWDLGFLALGLLQVAAGMRLVRLARRELPPSPARG